MIHPTIVAEVGAHALTLLKQAEDMIEASYGGTNAGERWLGEYREMIGHQELTADAEAKLREAGVIQ